MKTLALSLLLILLLPFAISENIVLTHVGFGETPKQVIVNIFNNKTESIKDPIFYVDGSFYVKTEMLLPPKGSANYIIYLEPGNHEIELRYQNESSKINIVNFIPEKNSENKNYDTTESNLRKIAITAVFILSAVLLYFLIIKKPKLMK